MEATITDRGGQRGDRACRRELDAARPERKFHDGKIHTRGAPVTDREIGLRCPSESGDCDEAVVLDRSDLVVVARVGS